MSIKISKRKHYMVIDFHGMNFDVPEWINYLAIDKSGEIFGYRNEPLFEIDRWEVQANKEKCKREFEFFGHYEFEGDWKESLLKIEKD